MTLLPAESAGSFVQVLLGFDTRPITAGMNTDEIAALFNSITIDVAQGDVTLQVPTFVYVDGNPNSITFDTIRNESLFGPGVHTFAGVPVTSSQNWFMSGVTSDGVIAQMQADADEYGDYFEILGVGFNGSAGAVVNSISFGGNTYYFGTGTCAPAAPTAPKSVQTAAH